MLKQLSPLILLGLAGCDYYDAFNLDRLAREYRQTCFGSETNECVTRRAEYNIKSAEFYKEQLEDEKEQIVDLAGDVAYEKMHEYLDGVIEVNEEDIPLWFFRWFAGEGPIWSPRRYPEHLLRPIDIKIAIQEISAQYGTSPSDDAGISPGDTALAGDSPSTRSSSVPADAQLTEEIDAYIASQQSEQSGYEYADAREVVMGDIDGNGTDEAIVLYTLEGAYGGNNSHQRLAVFSMANLRYALTADTTVSGASARLATYGNDRITLEAMFHSDDDPRCCPSLTEQVNYRLHDGILALADSR